MIKLSFEILIFSFCYLKKKYVSKLFAAGTVVVQIEIAAFAMQRTQLSLNIYSIYYLLIRFRDFLFLLSSGDGKRPDTRDRRR